MGEDIYLVLGCFGRKDHNFISCGGVENRILKIAPSLEHYNDIMTYCESCRLFDRPMFEMQAIRHFIHNMRERYDQVVTGKRLWSEQEYNLYQKFLIDHRLCGLYIKMILVDSGLDPEIIEPEEKKVLIKAEKSFSKEPSKGNLRLVRGRNKLGA